MKMTVDIWHVLCLSRASNKEKKL